MVLRDRRKRERQHRRFMDVMTEDMQPNEEKELFIFIIL